MLLSVSNLQKKLNQNMRTTAACMTIQKLDDILQVKGNQVTNFTVVPSICRSKTQKEQVEIDRLQFQSTLLLY